MESFHDGGEETKHVQMKGVSLSFLTLSRQQCASAIESLIVRIRWISQGFSHVVRPWDEHWSARDSLIKCSYLCLWFSREPWFTGGENELHMLKCSDDLQMYLILCHYQMVMVILLSTNSYPFISPHVPSKFAYIILDCTLSTQKSQVAARFCLCIQAMVCNVWNVSTWTWTFLNFSELQLCSAYQFYDHIHKIFIPMAVCHRPTV